MKNKISKIILEPSVLIVSLLILLIIVSYNTKGTKAVDSTYPSDDVVNNLAAVMIREIGCGGMGSQNANKEVFVYQMTWVNTIVNQYNFWFEGSKPLSTVVFDSDTLCKILARGGRGGSYNPNYCADVIDEDKEFSKCEPYEVEQLKLAVKMVLRKNFNIPRNVYYAAQKYVTHYVNYDLKTDTYERKKNIAEFQCYRTYAGGSPYYPGGDTRDIRKVCFTTQDTDTKLSTKDLYGNTISTDFNFYKNLADCLYDNPTLYGAYNKCPSSSKPTTTEYVVYLYPNGGTGIKDGQEFKYTETTPFSKFPTVTKTNCTLDGWNIDSPNGKEYNEDVEPIDNGKKLYARWDCSGTDTTKYTVTFKIDNDTSEIFHSEKVTSGSKVTKPSTNPSKYGYEFEGWKTSNGKDFDFNTKITSNITLYAKWGLEGDELVKPTNPIREETTNNDKANQDVETSAKTGTFEEIIVLVLIIPSLLAIYYYYNYYINSRKDSQS